MIQGTVLCTGMRRYNFSGSQSAVVTSNYSQVQKRRAPVSDTIRYVDKGDAEELAGLFIRVSQIL